MKNVIPIIAVAVGLSGMLQAAERPNIIIILADDLGYADLGCQGSPDIRTPNIDQLAASGIRFTDGYVPTSVCGPSRASLMTGKYSAEFGYRGNGDAEMGIPYDHKLIPEYLEQTDSKKRYFTAALGKWHLGDNPGQSPLDRGYDHFMGFISGSSHYFPLSKGGMKWNEERKFTRLQRNGTALDPKDYPEDIYMTDLLTQEAVDLINGHNGRGKKPFFLYVAYNAPHGPLQATEEGLQRNSHIEDKNRRTFAGMMSSLDDGVGRIIQALKDENLYQDTLVIFLSDNGGPTRVNTSRNDPFRGVKGEVWEGGIRVPFMVSWPAGIESGQVRSEPVISLDIAPTVLAFAGLDINPSLQGINLVPWLTDQVASLPRREFYFWRAGHRGMRADQLKFVHSQKGTLELFDLTTNKEEDPSRLLKNPERQSTFDEKLKNWERAWAPGLRD